MTRREYIWLIVLGFIFGFLLGNGVARRLYMQQPEPIRDTVVKKIPVYKDFPDPVKTAQVGFIAVPKCYFFLDTVTTLLHDTIPQFVYLPKEQKYYEEEGGDLRIWISGFQPNLDRYELDRLETTITETIYPGPKRWGLDLFAGTGGTIAGDQSLLGAQAGFELRYEPNRWGFGLLGGYGVIIMDGRAVPAPFFGGRAKLNILSW